MAEIDFAFANNVEHGNTGIIVLLLEKKIACVTKRKSQRGAVNGSYKYIAYRIFGRRN